jgi:hypothetical protein
MNDCFSYHHHHHHHHHHPYLNTGYLQLLFQLLFLCRLKFQFQLKIVDNSLDPCCASELHQKTFFFLQLKITHTVPILLDALI